MGSICGRTLGSSWGRSGVGLGSICGRCAAYLGSTRCRPGVDLRSIWCRSGVDLGSLWSRSGVVLGSFCGRSGVDPGSICGRSGVNLRSIWGRPGVELPKIQNCPRAIPESACNVAGDPASTTIEAARRMRFQSAALMALLPSTRSATSTWGRAGSAGGDLWIRPSRGAPPPRHVEQKVPAHPPHWRPDPGEPAIDRACRERPTPPDRT